MKKLLSIFTISLLSICVFAQDIIVTIKAQKIDAKILEVSTSEIRYKELDNLDGPTFILRVDEINSIIYANGKVVLYNQPKSDEELALERARLSAASKRQTEDERNDMERLERVRKEEEAARLKAQATSNKGKEAETIAKANAMGSLFGEGNPVGTGSVGGNNWTLAGRNLKALPKPSNNFNQAGKVVVEILVNAGGNVISAKQIGGTISDKQTIQLALDAAKKAKFTEGEHDQIGTITYTFKFN
jgi:hypothetical protein